MPFVDETPPQALADINHRLMMAERDLIELIEAAIFPGDLPAEPDTLFNPASSSIAGQWRFVRFRPPAAPLVQGHPQWPQIQLDRAVQFLIGDRLA